MSAQHVFIVGTTPRRGEIVLRCDCGHTAVLLPPPGGVHTPLADLDAAIVTHHKTIMSCPGCAGDLRIRRGFAKGCTCAVTA